MTYREYLSAQSSTGNQDAASIYNIAGDDGNLDARYSEQEDWDVLVSRNDYLREQYLNDGGSWGEAGVPYDPYAVDGAIDYSTTTEPVVDNSAEYASLDQAKGINEKKLSDSLIAQGAGDTRAGNWYDEQKGLGTTDYNTATSDYLLQEDRQKHGRQDAQSSANQNSRTLADSVRRILGMAGGIDSTAYRFDAPHMIGRAADKQRSGIMSQFGENLQNIGIAKGKTKDQYDQLLLDLASEKDRRIQTGRGDQYELRQGVYQDMIKNVGDRTVLDGGGYQAILDAQQPYMDKYNSLSDKILGLTSRYDSPYDPVKVQAGVDDSGPYKVDRQALNFQGQTGAAQGSSPYEYWLKKRNEENI